jgi:translation elongation factor EF-4
MIYFDRLKNKKFLLNLVDTPGGWSRTGTVILSQICMIIGHVDFSYEVNRSLSACEGVLLLVDCSQGIQAQTLATYYAAKEKGLTIVPVLTKIDVPHAQPEDSILSLSSLLGEYLAN